MCRLLAVRKKKEFEIAPFLKHFSRISKNSEEYQGHGWGLAYQKGGKWMHYKNVMPIWEDDLNQFQKTKFMIVHARSAFQDKGIIVKNNMPFYDQKYVFIFNGQLSGVKIKEKGRIGAEKIFNFIKRFDNKDAKKMLIKGIEQLKKRTKEYKAINVIMATKDKIFVSNNYNERPNYFQMYFNDSDGIVICSDPLDNTTSWKKFKNNEIRAW
jgi:predicted glutamine amidotransferase